MNRFYFRAVHSLGNTLEGHNNLPFEIGLAIQFDLYFRFFSNRDLN